MKIGCCVNMIPHDKTKTGIESIALIMALGFDYIELPLSSVMNLYSTGGFKDLKQQITVDKIPCEVSNSFFHRISV
jgi:hypothetical protein